MLFDVLRDFLKLALAHKGSDVGVVQRLGERADGLRMGCSGQEFEFIEVLGQQLSGLVPGNARPTKTARLGLAVFSCKGLLQHYSRKRSMYLGHSFDFSPVEDALLAGHGAFAIGNQGHALLQ